MSRPLPRREFLRRSALAGVSIAGIGYWSSASAAEGKSANEKLNLGVIGTANQARFSINNIKHENIVAICDIDEKYLGQAKMDFPAAETYHDFRKLLEQKEIDAVVIATPDHIHAPATAAALRLGKHVYCEKPLTHTVYEARTIADLAKKAKVATQMGTQIHAGGNYRRVVEIIQAGTIGPIREVHTWVNNKGWGGGERPMDTPPTPAHLHWDLWLGPAPERTYHNTYLPANWRKWWDFGGGTIADMACHHVDLPFWALKLHHPKTVVAEGPAVHSETCPLGLKVQYEFAERGDLPPVTLTWYDDNKCPKMLHDIKLPGSGNLFVGEKGSLYADYGGYKLYPEKDFMGFTPPPKSIPDSIGHHKEWLQACRTGDPTTCNFDYASALTETVLLGNVAFRTGQKLEWDSTAMKATNCPDADKFLRREYRTGWTL